MRPVRLVYAQMLIGFVICLVGISYWLFWHSGIRIRPILISTRLWLQTNKSLTCLDELLLGFGIESVDFSRPTYIRLDNPAPISRSCQQLFISSSPPPKNFSESEKITPSQQMHIHTVVNWLRTNFSKHNLELFLAGGSLLGSVRHFGMFPWDADADVMILTNQKPMIRKVLIEMSSSDELYFTDSEHWGHWQLGIFCKPERDKKPTRMYGTDRLYPSKACPTIVDFFFGSVEGKLYKRVDYPNSFPIEHVYPLTLRPFGQYLLPVPRNPDKFLTAVYGKDYETKCHMKYFKNKDYKCSELRSIYPFVTHLVLPYGSKSVQVDVLVHQSKMVSLFIPKQF